MTSRVPLFQFHGTLLFLLSIMVAKAAPGDVDPNLDVGLGTKGTIRAVAVDDQNRLIVAGSFSTFNGDSAGRILRLLEDGSVDSSFDVGVGANSDIKAVELMSDQRILVGGQFTSFNGTTTRGLVLLDPDGSVDESFTSRFDSDGFSVGVTCLEELPNGDIMMGGYFTKYAGSNAGRFAVIDDAGALVGPVSPASGADSHVFDIDVLPNGKVLICGFFDFVDGHSSACVARLLSNGAVDTTFGTGANLGSVAYTVEGASDGTVIIGGSFSNYFGLGQRYLGRLTSTGLPDPTYQGNTGPDLNVYGITLDPEGRLIIAGQFSEFSGTTVNGVGRLLQDGALDPEFGFESPVSASFIQEYPIDSKGRILVYGGSNFFGDPEKVNLHRIAGGDWRPQDTWRLDHFGKTASVGEAAWTAIPAGDGVTNLQKYALGFQGDPRVPVRLWGDDGLMFGFWKSESLSGFRYRTDSTRDDAAVSAEWSELLKNWTSEGLLVTEEGREDDLITWKVTLPGGFPSAFFRLYVTAED